MFRHGDGILAVGGKVKRTIDGRTAHLADAFGTPDHQLARAAVVEEFFIGRTGQQILIRADRLLLSQHFLDDGGLRHSVVRGFFPVVGNRLEEDVAVVEEEERRAEDGVHPLVGEPLGDGLSRRRIDAPQFYAVGEIQRKADIAAARRPGDELHAVALGKALDRTHRSGGHVKDFQLVEIVLTGLAEIARIQADAADTCFAGSKFGNRDVAVLAIAYRGPLIVGGVVERRKRTCHRNGLNLRGWMAETIGKEHRASGQEQDGCKDQESFHVCSRFIWTGFGNNSAPQPGRESRSRRSSPSPSRAWCRAARGWPGGAGRTKRRNVRRIRPGRRCRC